MLSAEEKPGPGPGEAKKRWWSLPWRLEGTAGAEDARGSDREKARHQAPGIRHRASGTGHRAPGTRKGKVDSLGDEGEVEGEAGLAAAEGDGEVFAGSASAEEADEFGDVANGVGGLVFGGEGDDDIAGAEW